MVTAEQALNVYRDSMDALTVDDDGAPMLCLVDAKGGTRVLGGDPSYWAAVVAQTREKAGVELIVGGLDARGQVADPALVDHLPPPQERPECLIAFVIGRGTVEVVVQHYDRVGGVFVFGEPEFPGSLGGSVAVLVAALSDAAWGRNES